MVKKIIFILISLLMINGLYSQSVRASVESSEVYIGQPFEYRIIIEGSTDTTRPGLPEVPNLEKAYKGASTSVVSSFGTGGNSSSKTVTHSWLFTPLKAGILTIPSFVVMIDGKEYSTASGTITVKNPEPQEGFHLIMETDKEEFWDGEPINLSIRWLFSTSVSDPVFNIPFINSGDFRAESQNPPPGSDVYRISIAGMEVLSMQSAEIYKGKQFSTLSFQLKLIPQKTGIYTLDPVTLAFDKAERSNGFRTSYKSVVIPSNSLSLEIRTLPSDAGQNIILSSDKLEIEAEADPLQVHIGDPLTYTIRVKGAAVPENVEIPHLNSFSEMERNFSIPEKRSSARIEERIVTFTQTIRVKQEDVEVIPQLELPYFNIETGKIEKAIIPEIPLEVMPTQVVTSADLETTGYSGSERPVKRTLENADDGLKHNFSPDEILMSGGDSSIIQRILLSIPFLLMITVLSFKYRNHIAAFILRMKKDNEDFREIYLRIKDNDERTAYEAIKTYLLEYCQMEGLSKTPYEIYDCLLCSENDRELCQSIRDLLCTLEESVYSSTGKPMEKDAAETFYSLSKELK